MQNRLAVQDTVVGSPVYSVAVGTTFCGADHELPFHATTDPPRSAARQNEAVGQEIESRPPPGSTACRGDQLLPVMRYDTSVSRTMAHRVEVGQATAPACAVEASVRRSRVPVPRARC